MIAQNPRFYTHKIARSQATAVECHALKRCTLRHESCLAFFVNNKDFDKRLIVTYSIKYRNYLRKIREKQVIRAQKTLHNGKVHAKKVLLKLTRALEFQYPLKFRCQTRELHELERIVKGNFLGGLGGFFGLTVSCACFSKFVGIRRNFLGC